ncbi:hypothetical protein F5Y16DRAFT_425193 [Xylariaceae sp. FL0255]|nr:hypothetical protein F5Y16DRAFT_425193 [Xylariaceae sp. FL0255]
MSFFQKSLIDKPLLGDKAAREELFNELTYLLLAIAQAAVYLNQTQISLKRYIERLRRTEQNLVNLISQDFHDDARYPGSRNAVTTIWLVSFDQISSSDSTAAELLAFISYIERQDIPQSMLPGSSSEPSSREKLENAIDVLCGYTFLVRRDPDDDVFNMHRLVQSKRYKHKERFDLSYRVGRCLTADRRFKEATVALEEICRWKREYLEEEDHSRLASEHALARAYLSDRRIREAIEIFEHMVAVQKKTLAEEDHNRLASEHALASAYLDDRRIRKAIEIFEHVVAVEMLLDLGDEDRTMSQHLLQDAYNMQREKPD